MIIGDDGDADHDDDNGDDTPDDDDDDDDDDGDDDVMMSCLALRVQRGVRSWQAAGSWQRVVRVVWRVVEAGGGGSSQEVFHLLDRTIRPLETSRCSSQVAHHVAISPGARFSAGGTAQVRWRWVTIVDSTKQMADLMGSHHNPGVGTTVFNKGNAADFR